MPDKNLSVAIEIKAKDSASGALSKTRAGLQSISEQLAAARAQFIAFQASMLSLGRIAALAKLADDIALVNARLRLAVDDARAFAEAQQFAHDVAARTGAGFEAGAG